MLFALLLCQVFSLVVITASVSVEISRAVTFTRLSRATLQRQHSNGSCRRRRGLTAVFMPPYVGSSEDTFHTCADKLTLDAKFYVSNSLWSWAPVSYCIYGLTSRRGRKTNTHDRHKTSLADNANWVTRLSIQQPDAIWESNPILCDMQLLSNDP